MTSTEIKLSPAMENALKGAQIGFSPNFGVYTGIVAEDTKSQTVKGLAKRGLSDDSGVLTTDGVEAARQLGVELPPWQAPGTAVAAAQIEQEIAEGIITPHPDRVVEEEPLADWERELLHSNPWESKTGTDTNDVQASTYTKSVEVTAPPVIESTPIGHDFGTTTPETDAPSVDAGLSAQIAKLVDTPVVVPNREDKRKMKFSLRAAASRLFQRQKNRRIQKYGTTKYGEVSA